MLVVRLCEEVNGRKYYWEEEYDYCEGDIVKKLLGFKQFLWLTIFDDESLRLWEYSDRKLKRLA